MSRTTRMPLITLGPVWILLCGISGCDAICKDCQDSGNQVTCGEGTILRKVEGGSPECVVSAPLRLCGAGTYEAEYDGRGTIIDRDTVVCKSITASTICGKGTVEMDGGGTPVDRDTVEGTKSFAITTVCVAGVVAED